MDQMDGLDGMMDGSNRWLKWMVEMVGLDEWLK